MHEYILECLCVDISTVTVTLSSQQFIEILVVDDDTQADAGVLVAVALQLKGGCLSRRGTQSAHKHISILLCGEHKKYIYIF